MAKQAGVPLDRLYHTLRTCTADSWMLRSLEGAILRGEYPPATFLGLKDLTAAVESGRSVHQAMPVTSLAREIYQLIDAKLGGLQAPTRCCATTWSRDGPRRSPDRLQVPLHRDLADLSAHRLTDEHRRRPAWSAFGQASLEIATDALMRSKKVGHGLVGGVQVAGLAFGIVRIRVGDPVPDRDEQAEARRRREGAKPVHQFCHFAAREAPDVLAPDDRDHLEQLILDGVDELLVALEEGIEVIFDIEWQRRQPRGRQRELRGQLALRPGQAAGAAFGGAEGLPGQRRFLRAHSGTPSRSAIRSSGVNADPRS